MGAVASLAVAACSCASCTFSCCCKASKAVEGRVAKTYYFGFFIVAAVVALILNSIHSMPSLVKFFSFRAGCAEESLDSCFGVQSIFRISFGLFLFFAAMLLVCWNDGIFLGVWGLKVVLWVIFTIIVFFFHYDAIAGYTKFAEAMSFFYLVVQILILLELAYRLQGYFSVKIELRESGLRAEYSTVGIFQNCWKWCYILVVLVLQVGSYAMLGWLVHTADKSCHDVLGFAAVTIIAGIVFTFMSMLSCLDNRGLMPPSVVFAYCTWLCFTAIANSPHPECRPAHVAPAAKWSGVVVGVITLAFCSFMSDSGIPGLFSFKEAEAAAAESESLIDPKTTSAAPVEVKSEGGGTGADPEVAEEQREPASSAPAAPIAKRYWTYTLTMLFASLYLAMLLSDWSVTSKTNGPQTTTRAMYIIMASQWVALLLFLWSLIAPKLFPDRDFT